MPVCLDCLLFCSAFMCCLVLCNVWHYLQVQMASWAPALTGQHSFFCCQMMPGTVFVQADSQHCLPWTEADSSMGLPERTKKKLSLQTLVLIPLVSPLTSDYRRQKVNGSITMKEKNWFTFGLKWGGNWGVILIVSLLPWESLCSMFASLLLLMLVPV